MREGKGDKGRERQREEDRGRARVRGIARDLKRKREKDRGREQESVGRRRMMQTSNKVKLMGGKYTWQAGVREKDSRVAGEWERGHRSIQKRNMGRKGIFTLGNGRRTEIYKGGLGGWYRGMNGRMESRRGGKGHGGRSEGRKRRRMKSRRGRWMEARLAVGDVWRGIKRRETACTSRWAA